MVAAEVAGIGGFVGSPIWPTILSAAAILVSLWLYYRQRTRKSLAGAINQIELINRRETPEEIEVLFEHKAVEQVHLIEASVENTGNVSVEKEDFHQALAIDLGEGSTALSADATCVTAEGREIEAKGRGNQVEIEPFLLNAGDRVTLKAFVRDFGGQVDWQCHIAGISAIEDGALRSQGRLLSLRRRLKTRPVRGPLLAVAVGTAVVASLLAASAWLAGPAKTNSAVVTWANEMLCGKILVNSDRRIILQLGDDGFIRSIRLGDVKSINDNAC